MSIAVLEVPFRVDFGPGLDEADVQRITASWSSCAGAPDDTALVVHADVIVDGASRPSTGIRVHTRSVAQLEESLTSTLTVEAIGVRRHDLLMLHACGMAAEDGRVLAFVAASGTGKTTIARALGTRFGYVTDETVGVTPTGRVLPYPKPLSVKPLTGSAPKAQLAPDSIGLRPIPKAPLVLAGVVLLDRREHVEVPRLEAVDPIEAIDLLVPQTSYLSARPRPLTDLVETLRGLGGVTRLVYSEATGALDLVEAAFATVAVDAPDAWNEILSLGLETPDAPVGGLLVRAPVDDAILLAGGELVVFCDNRLARLEGIGPALWHLTGEAISADELVEAVVTSVGPAPEGVDARAAVSAALVELMALGVITRTPASAPTPDGVHA
ncbi:MULTISPECIES: hypothetical protein [unclassified Rathayibacter]|uniref:hypothetical protein n=1 Tax=unclassified Rathayibacter TaxID=2609250 RepID=UPI0006F2966D|nr:MULTISPECIES: hypothetical protein [unclassified Rathayibacter]KQQ03912.1 hypothetical protein ASF42_10680 [Rathayibacter sp. Leaf294]KQS12367.1 hypothetical protein ASG06_10680 [Rathayibacter sp. Leaf185]